MLKEKFVQSNLMLTMTFVVSENFEYEYYNLSNLSACVDFISFEFDFKRTEGVYRIDNALDLLDTWYVQNNVEKLLESGVPADKIVIGIHFVGPAFTIAPRAKSEFRGVHKYGSVCKAQSTQPDQWEKLTPISRLSILKKRSHNLTIVMESSRSIANKVRFAMKSGLAGIAPIHIASDDYEGKCRVDDDTFDDYSDVTEDIVFLERKEIDFPLIRTINEAIDVTLDEMAQEKKLPKFQKEAVEPAGRVDMKVVCPVLMRSDMEARNMSFEFEKVNWNLCTHVICVNKDGTGMDRI